MQKFRNVKAVLLYRLGWGWGHRADDCLFKILVGRNERFWENLVTLADGKAVSSLFIKETIISASQELTAFPPRVQGSELFQ